jgi:hypothetical protein
MRQKLDISFIEDAQKHLDDAERSLTAAVGKIGARAGRAYGTNWGAYRMAVGLLLKLRVVRDELERQHHFSKVFGDGKS